LLEVSNLNKRMGGQVVIDGLSFEIAEGGIHVILGPDGAGKSTLLDIISGCRAAESGRVTICGEEMTVTSLDQKRRIGYMPEDMPLYEDMTVQEYLVFIGEAKGVSPEKLYKNINSALELTTLDTVSGRLIKKLSAGEKKLLGIAQAMLGNPDIIILDEPTASMTRIQKACFEDLMGKLGRIKTVIIATRSLSALDGLCEDLMMISRGKLIAHDTKKALEEKLCAVKTLTLTVRGSEESIVSALESVGSVTDCTFSKRSGGTVSVKIEYDTDRDIRDEVFRAFAAVNCPILSMETTTLTLDDVYMKLTGESDGKGGKEK